MNNVAATMHGTIIAFLIIAGYLLLWCGVICLIWSFADDTGDGADLRWCAVMCLVLSAIQFGSGFGWYTVVRRRMET